MSQVIAVTSGKGGAGKSTVCVGLGQALARAGQNVLIIELDCGLRGLDLMLGVQDQVVYDLGDLLNGGCNVGKAIIPSAYQDKLSMIAAPVKFDLSYSMEDLTLLCRGLRNAFDVVFLDMPAGLMLSTQLTSTVADRILIVTVPDPVCIRDGEHLAQLLEQNGPLPMNLIINRASLRNLKKGLIRDLDDVIDQVGVPLIGVIPDEEAVMVRTCSGQMLEQDSLAAVAFGRIASRLGGEYLPLAVQ